MRINEEAVSFSAFSLTKIVIAELLRKGILDQGPHIVLQGREGVATGKHWGLRTCRGFKGLLARECVND